MTTGDGSANGKRTQNFTSWSRGIVYRAVNEHDDEANEKFDPKSLQRRSQTLERYVLPLVHGIRWGWKYVVRWRVLDVGDTHHAGCLGWRLILLVDGDVASP